MLVCPNTFDSWWIGLSKYSLAQADGYNCWQGASFQACKVTEYA